MLTRAVVVVTVVEIEILFNIIIVRKSNYGQQMIIPVQSFLNQTTKILRERILVMQEMINCR